MILEGLTDAFCNSFVKENNYFIAATLEEMYLAAKGQYLDCVIDLNEINEQAKNLFEKDANNKNSHFYKFTDIENLGNFFELHGLTFKRITSSKYKISWNVKNYKNKPNQGKNNCNAEGAIIGSVIGGFGGGAPGALLGGILGHTIFD